MAFGEVIYEKVYASPAVGQLSPSLVVFGLSGAEVSSCLQTGIWN